VFFVVMFVFVFSFFRFFSAAHKWIEADEETLHLPEFHKYQASEEHSSLNFKFQYPDKNQQELHFIISPVDIIVPLSYGPYPTMEELKANPLTLECQRQMMENVLLNLSIDEKPT